MDKFAIIQWEDKFTSVINLNSIKTPRKGVEEYTEGEYVTAMYGKTPYKARISTICSDRAILLRERKDGQYPLQYCYENPQAPAGKDKETESIDEESSLQKLAKKAKDDEKMRKKIKEKERANTANTISKELLINTSDVVLEKLEEIINTNQQILRNQEKFEKFIQCKDCLRALYRAIKNKDDVKPQVLPVTPKQNCSVEIEHTKIDCTNTGHRGLATPRSLESGYSISGHSEGQLGEQEEQIQEISDELTYLGDARLGIKMRADHLKRCEDSSTPEKFVLNLIEYLFTKEDCKDLTVYGQGKDKKPIEKNLRQAIRSHTFNLFQEYVGKLSEEEKNKLWFSTLVYKINDKLRGIRNGNYVSKK